MPDGSRRRNANAAQDQAADRLPATRSRPGKEKGRDFDGPAAPAKEANSYYLPPACTPPARL